MLKTAKLQRHTFNSVRLVKVMIMSIVLQFIAYNINKLLENLVCLKSSSQ